MPPQEAVPLLRKAVKNAMSIVRGASSKEVEVAVTVAARSCARSLTAEQLARVVEDGDTSFLEAAELRQHFEHPECKRHGRPRVRFRHWAAVAFDRFVVAGRSSKNEKQTEKRMSEQCWRKYQAQVWRGMDKAAKQSFLPAGFEITSQNDKKADEPQHDDAEPAPSTPAEKPKDDDADAEPASTTKLRGPIHAEEAEEHDGAWRCSVQCSVRADSQR